MPILFSQFFLALLSGVLYCVSALYGLHFLIALCNYIRRKPLPSALSFWKAPYIALLLCISAYVCSAESRNGLYLFFLRTCLSLLFCAACYILENIVRFGGVEKAMLDMVMQFLKAIDICKSFLETVGAFLQKHGRVVYWLLVLLTIISLVLFGERSFVGSVLYTSLWLTLGYFLYLAYALHSCRRLMLLLLGFSFVYAIQVAGLLGYVARNAGFGQTDDFLLLLVLLVYVLLWIFTALVAEDEPVQLVFKITNTFTTLAAIVGNILIPIILSEVVGNAPIVPGYDNNTSLSIVFNLFILPLVAAGYLAQLAKDVQVYLKNRCF